MQWVFAMSKKKSQLFVRLLYIYKRDAALTLGILSVIINIFLVFPKLPNSISIERGRGSSRMLHG
jgi:hypothetical protein